MTVLRLQCTIGADTALPRDRFVITPHFNVGPDFGLDDGSADELCEDLATGLSGFFTPSNGREIVVKAYNAEQARGNFPLGEAVRNANIYPSSQVPRELAICLSYYAARNIPRRRGRLYIPWAAIAASGSISPRPSQAQRELVGTLAGIFQNLGGTNVDWVVWSRADSAAHSVTHWWVDDEWDVQRRRGFKGTTRTLGTTSEAGIP
jgi:hypothetical protein